MKKTAVVYYSMSGNTDYVSKKICELTGAELIRINPVKEYPSKGFKKFLWGGKSAVMKETPALEKYSFDAKEYDLVVLGSPVWAGTFSPPVRTFVKENKDKLQNKKIASFFCSSGGDASKAAEKLKNFIGISDFEDVLTLVDPKDREKGGDLEKISSFCKKITDSDE